MKKVFIASYFLLLGMTGRTQLVTIPDAGFVTWLTNNYPSCISGNQLDTSCPAVLNANSITFGNQNIANLSGIEYFVNLDSLNCSMFYGQLTTIPAFPPNLTYLSCGFNVNLQTYPAFPSSLLYLDCSNSNLSVLPALPSGLTTLFCQSNVLTSLPALPVGLTELNCYSNLLTTLPTLPSNLSVLSTGYNPNLTSLPAIPNTMQWLSVPDCALSTLPALPATLPFLDCSNNLLTTISSIPNGMQYYYCNHNLLTSLPSLPSGLLGLYCSGNQLMSLPTLPNLTDLWCDSNQISCFPTFPNSLDFSGWGFNISGNPFTCLPNYVSVMDTATLAYPLCVDNDPINNPNNCSGSTGISGVAFLDNNSNCVYDAGDLPLQNIPINLYDGANIFIGQTTTAQNGVYQFVQTYGTYRVEIDTASLPFDALCSLDSSLSLDANTPMQGNVNFALACPSTFDIGVQSVLTSGMIFPGQSHTVQTVAGDFSAWFAQSCVSGLGGQITISINGPAVFSAPSAGSLIPTVNANQLIYAITDFSTLGMHDLDFVLQTNTSAQAGDQICLDVMVTPTLNDADTSNNFYQFCYTVVNSCDPNHKEVYPEVVQPGYNDWLTYTVHFQNVGTAPAINIVIKDTLDASLDVKSFEVLACSHDKRISLLNGILTIRFDNILLIDSASNPAASMGYIQYRIKPLVALTLAEQITNTAHIYFDYNAPLATNTATTSCIQVNGLEEGVLSEVHVFPNPTRGLFSIELISNLEQEVKIYNTQGQEIMKQKIASGNTNIDLSAQVSGLYILRFADGQSYRLTKL